MARRQSFLLVVLFLLSLCFYGKEVSNDASQKASSSSTEPTRSKQKRQPLLGNPSNAKPLTNTNNNVEPTGQAYYSSVLFSIKTQYDSLVGGRGVFSVDNEGTKVTFATGNLQYQASTGKWRFASEQWETVGADNAQISASNDNWIDLFGWGTSGYHDASDNCNTNYQPYASASAAQSLTCGTNNKYGYGPTSTGVMNLTGDFASYDWGVYNTISASFNHYTIDTEHKYAIVNTTTTSQTYTPGTWRTLTASEWEYLINTRKVEFNEKVGWCLATVGSNFGLLLFPDEFSLRKYETISSFKESSYGGTATISITNWTYLEAIGCVFLPGASRRNGTTVDAGQSCHYWSSTATSDGYSASGSYGLYVQANGTSQSAMNVKQEKERCQGSSVRLVHVLTGEKVYY